MKYKHGQRVTCEIAETKITNAKISIDSNGQPYICQNIKKGKDADDKLGYKYSWMLDFSFTNAFVTNLKPAEKTWDNLEAGDIIVDRYGDEQKVIDVLPNSFLLSYKNNFEKAGGLFTPKEAQQNDWTIKQDHIEEEVLELTLDDVAEKFGKDVSKIKIKKS